MDNKVLEKIDEKEKVKQNCYNDEKKESHHYLDP